MSFKSLKFVESSVNCVFYSIQIILFTQWCLKSSNPLFIEKPKF